MKMQYKAPQAQLTRGVMVKADGKWSNPVIKPHFCQNSFVHFIWLDKILKKLSCGLRVTVSYDHSCTFFSALQLEPETLINAYIFYCVFALNREMSRGDNKTFDIFAYHE